MEDRLEQEISLQIPSNLNFETFSSFRLPVISSSSSSSSGGTTTTTSISNSNSYSSRVYDKLIVGGLRSISEMGNNRSSILNSGNGSSSSSTSTSNGIIIISDNSSYPTTTSDNYFNSNIIVNSLTENSGLKSFTGHDYQNSVTQQRIIDLVNSEGSGNGGSGGDDGLLQKLSENFGRGLSSSEVNMIRNQVILGSSQQHAEDLLKQMEYDKFMNEIWIGIVLTLIVISLVFCICSCFLYHQFRQWKRTYRQNIQRNIDIESVKLNPEDDDPVPNYTLVSGLPSYEAALELLKSSSSRTCLLPAPAPPYPPTVFHVFSTNEKDDSVTSSTCQKLASSTVELVTATAAITTAPQPPISEEKNELNSIPSYEEAIMSEKSDSHLMTSTEKTCNDSDEALLDTKPSSS